MTEPTRQQFLPDYAVPPGETLKEWLEESGMTVKEFAEKANLNHTLVKLLLIGAYPIDTTIAVRLAVVTEICAQFWLKSEENYQADLKRLNLERPTPNE